MSYFDYDSISVLDLTRAMNGFDTEWRLRCNAVGNLAILEDGVTIGYIDFRNGSVEWFDDEGCG